MTGGAGTERDGERNLEIVGRTKKAGITHTQMYGR